MSQKTEQPHVRFLLPEDIVDRDSADVFGASSELLPLVAPPPWQPIFEDLSSESSPSLLLHRRPLDPPPRCFSKPSPIRMKSHDFPPFRIRSVSDKLTDGFHVLYPQDLLEKHGISRADWLRFLEDLGVAARLSAKGLGAIRSCVPVRPLLAHHIFPPRVLGSVYDSAFARSTLEEVRALIAIWNECAFERRKLRVTLRISLNEMGNTRRYELVVESL